MTQRLTHLLPGRGPTAIRPRRGRLGVSLAELTVSLVVIATVMLATGSVMVVTGRAVGLSATHATEAKVDDVLATIAAEHRFALTVTDHKPNTVTFTVADRDGDGAPETIRYFWGGKDTALTREVNGSSPAVLVPKVSYFNLSYLIRYAASATPDPPEELESEETLLHAVEGGSGVSVPVSTTNWYAQHIKPNWANVAPGKVVTAWRVTKIQVIASRATSTTRVLWPVRLYNPDPVSLKPTGSALEEQKLLTEFLPVSNSPSAFISNPLLFSSNAGLDPAKGLCVTIGQPSLTSPSPSGYLSYYGSSGGLMTSINGGFSYGSPHASRHLRIRVYGRYKYQGP